MKKESIQQGIYRIVNTQNGKSYIGRTTNFERRFKEHADSLRRNGHKNKRLQDDYNISTQDLFQYEILKQLDSMNESRKEEHYYIKKFEPSGIYNIGTPLMEYNVVLDREETIFDTIPKEMISKYSYEEIKDRTFVNVKYHMEQMKRFSDIEKHGVMYWSFYSIFHEIHSQLFWHSTDPRFLLALKEVLEEGGFQVVLATYNSKKMSHFIPKHMKEYIVIKNETMYSIHYSFEKVLKLHEEMRKRKEKREHERKDEELKSLLDTIASKNKEITRLEKKFEKEKQDRKEVII